MKFLAILVLFFSGLAQAQNPAPIETAPSLVAAFLAGLLSFVSPCVLPLMPSYLAVLSGAGKNPMRGAIGFVTGFSLVFIALGASASLLGSVLLNNRDTLTKMGAVLILIFGAVMIFKNQIPFLAREYRSDLGAISRYGTVPLGAAFAAGWTPCIGPILGTILSFASASASVGTGVLLLAMYAAGLAVPFFIAALAWNKVSKSFKQFGRYVTSIERIGGIVLIAVGILLLTDQYTIMAAWLQSHTPAWLQNLY